MEKHGHYHLKKLAGNRLHYAVAEVKTEVSGHNYDLTIDLAFACGKYKSAVALGIQYFFEHYRRTGDSKGVKVTLLRLLEMDGDSTFITVTYVVVKALCDAYQFEIAGLALHEETGQYVFPR